MNHDSPWILNNTQKKKFEFEHTFFFLSSQHKSNTEGFFATNMPGDWQNIKTNTKVFQGWCYPLYQIKHEKVTYFKTILTENI